METKTQDREPPKKSVPKIKLPDKRYCVEGGAKGFGGQGTIYKALDTKMQRNVALKCIRASFLPSNKKERLLSEARMLAGFRHPNIVAVFDFLEPTLLNRHDYILVMDWIDGEDLCIRQSKAPLSPEQSHNLILTLAKTIQALHKEKILHRDIKPQNVMLTKDDHVYLVDFGLAKSTINRQSLTKEGCGVGSERYSSPEQLEGKEITEKTDIFSLGALWYELLTQKWFYQGHNDPTPILKCIRDQMMAKELASTCIKMVAMTPEQRPTIFEVINVLEKYKNLVAVNIHVTNCILCGRKAQKLLSCKICQRSYICENNCYDIRFDKCTECVSKELPSGAEKVPEAAVFEQLENGITPFEMRVWTEKLRSTTRDFKVVPRKEFGNYKIGDVAEIYFQSDQDVYVYFFNIGTSGKINCIFPNNLSKNNFVKANCRYKFPDESSAFDWELSGPPGKEVVKVIAIDARQLDSKEKWEETIQTTSNHESIFDIISLPQNIELLTKSLQELLPHSWNQATCNVIVKGKNE